MYQRLNEASKYVHGSILIIPNNDVITPYVLPPLINYLERSHRIGIVSPSVVEFETLNEFEFYSLSKDTTTRTKKCKLDPFYVIERKLWIVLGEFDKTYYFYDEETDLCMKAELLGFRVLVLPSIIVYHQTILNC